MLRNTALALALATTATLGCSSEQEPPPAAPGATEVVFDLTADLAAPGRFYDLPYPSDLRLSAAGTPELTGFPNPDAIPIVTGLLPAAEQRAGFPVMPVAYFKLSGPVAALDPETVIPADPSSPILLIDIDPASPERGRLIPTVAATPPADDYVPENLLAVAPHPGFVLHGRRRYAFVIRRSLKDAAGAPLGVDPTTAALLASQAPAGAQGAAARDLYAPLLEAIGGAGIAADTIAAATVFTTGDVVADLFELSTAVLAARSVEITGLALDPDGGADHERFCELHGTVRYPQFQKGTPPYDTEGLFEIGADGLPVVQREEDAPVVVVIPRTPMPPGGYPLMVYFHGSGGRSDQVVEYGPSTEADGPPEPGKGPSHVLAAFGIATAGSALPVNPERLPGASETAYLNVDNLAAMRDTFRQGVIEQRLFLEVLRKLTISPDLVAACAGPSLPTGEASYRFAEDKLLAQGQSMGGMYTNMISAVEPRVLASVPTGAGGFWSYFILKTSLIPNVSGFLGLVLGTPQKLTFMHPALHLFETACEAADPVVYMPRLAARPLPGHPVRPVYDPAGKDDSYFPTVVYDAVALAYGHDQAGDVVWPTMQEALALDGRQGVLPYPVKQNRAAEGSGAPYTGAIVQYEGDGFYDPHAIYRQLDAVKYQYGCFFSTFLKNGVATLPAPAPMGTPCAE